MASRGGIGIHVLVLNQYAAPPGSAGITRHADVGAELVRRGHEVTIVASSFDYLTRGERDYLPATKAGVRFVWLRTGSYRTNDRRRVASMVRYGMQATMRRIPADVVVGSSPHLLAGLAAALSRRPWVLEVRDFWPSHMVDLGGVRRGSVTHRALERLERWLYRRADGIITIPPHGDVRLHELGIPTDKWVHVPTHASIGPVERVPHERWTVVYVGAHGVANDLATVMAAARLLPEVAFVTVGGGQMLTSLNPPPNVTLHGPVPKANVGSILARADVGLVSLAPADVFRYGISPNKLADYQAAALPALVASKYPVHGAATYRPGDPEDLVRAIREAMSNPPPVARPATLAEVTARFEAVLSDVIRGSRS